MSEIVRTLRYTKVQNVESNETSVIYILVYVQNNEAPLHGHFYAEQVVVAQCR
jgi:hypothetical protein